MLAIDTETRSLVWRERVGTVFMVQWADAHGEHFCTEDEGWGRFLAALATDDLLVFANASFDIHHLRASGIVDLLSSGHRCHDVTTLARVALPGRIGYKPYGLESLGTDLLGADATEAQRSLAAAAKLHGVPWTIQNRDYYALWRAEPELLERYGMEDVRLTYDLFKLVYARALASDIDVYRTEITGVAPLLRAAERDGVLVDQARLAVLRTRLEAERDELRFRLLAQGLSEAALGALDEEGEAGTASSKALLADLLRCGVPLYRLTKTSGKPKMDRKTGKPKRGADGKIIRNPNQLAVNKDALTEFKERFPVVGDLMDWRGRKQVLSTYVGALEAADPRVHASFSQCEARTSRASCSKPNMQNLPTAEKEREDGTYDVGVRHVLIPGPGNALLAADYDSIEVRALAHYIADPELTEQLDAGLDLHQRTAYRVALANGERCQFEDFVKGGPRDTDRTVAKVTTFLSLYGGGARLLATRLNVPVEAAAKIKADTLAAIPGYHELNDRIKRAVLSRAFPHVVTILGRRLFVPKDYVGLNTLIQGTSAEIMKLGMIAAAPVLAEYGWAIRLVVHDELVAEGPAACADEALAATLGAMEGCYPLSPRLKATGSWSTDSYGKAK